jgi:hypothetical protein
MIDGMRMNVAPPRTLRMASVKKRVRSGDDGFSDAMVACDVVSMSVEDGGRKRLGSARRLG